MRERRIATAIAVVSLVLDQPGAGRHFVRLSFFNRDWFNAIQDKDEAAVLDAAASLSSRRWAFDLYRSAPSSNLSCSRLSSFAGGAGSPTIISAAGSTDGTHYRMALPGGDADNPDQRIAEDINRFIDGGQIGYGIYSYSILLISTLSSLVSFSILLWGFGELHLPGHGRSSVPGFLFWVALIYAGVGTLVTHLIGRPLVAALLRAAAL